MSATTLVAQPEADELRLVRQIRRARIVNAMVLIVGVPVVHTVSGWLEAMLVFAVVGVSTYIPHAVSRRSTQRLQRAFDQGRPAAARRELAGLKTLYAGVRSAREGLRLVEAGILLLEERFEESERLLEAIRPERLRPHERVGLDLYKAWCRVERGDAEAALALAQSMLDRSARLDAQRRTSCLCLLARAHERRGESTLALARLDEALAWSVRYPPGRARSLYQRGRVLIGLGRTEEARAAFTEAIEAAPDSRSAARAREELAAVALHAPYR